MAVLAFLAALSVHAEADLSRKFTETITTKNGEELSFDMVLIQGGVFVMGSPATETGRLEHEGPQREVTVDPFYLCTTETTLDLFMAYYQETGTAKKDYVDIAEAQQDEEAADADVDTITGPTPVYGDMTMGYSLQHPAIGLTWHNAQTFCRWLSQKTGRQYRLPTEAEWEYAARTGSRSVFGIGDSEEVLQEHAWYAENADMEPHEVATRKPTAWGLYDMLGNVREWVADFYSPTAYQKAVEAGDNVNPRGPKEGRVHVARGGFYDSEADELRAAARGYEEDWWRMNDPQIPKSRGWLPQIDSIGFRVACEVPKQ
jgi:formylglycine-generating enzyme required for sulfatase activity